MRQSETPPGCTGSRIALLSPGEIRVRWLSTAFHNYGDVFGRRGARIARREEGECREHLTDEQRSEAGCIGGRYVGVIVKHST
jgi:hypothetical protein